MEIKPEQLNKIFKALLIKHGYKNLVMESEISELLQKVYNLGKSEILLSSFENLPNKCDLKKSIDEKLNIAKSLLIEVDNQINPDTPKSPFCKIHVKIKAFLLQH